MAIKILINSVFKMSGLLSRSRKTILLYGFIVLSIFLFGTIKTIAQSEEDAVEESLNVEEINDSVEKVREEIKQVQEKIDSYAAEVKAQQKKAKTLNGELNIYKNNIYKNELEVEETKLKIKETELEAKETQKKIQEGEKRIEKNREILKNSVKFLYMYEQDSMFEVLITKNNISEFFNEIDAMESVKDGIFETIVNLKEEKEGLITKEIDLEDAQVQQQELIRVKDQQNERLEELKKQKDELLTFTKGEEKKFQQVLEENKNILPSLKAKLHDLQSLGNKIKFEDAFSAAKYVGSVTGVRPAYLLGILKVESDLGVNTGSGNWNDDMYQCYLRISKNYAKTAERKKYYIKRAEDEKGAYMSIVNRLNIDPDSVKVSREPSYGCGGAMGAAQFIPTTWLAYEERISSFTGHYPANPWDLTDAIAAMAIKVSDVSGVTSKNYDAEYDAAGRYLGGANWKRKGLGFYPDRVMLYANLYEEELN